jgi:hypothetical protein
MKCEPGKNAVFWNVSFVEDYFVFGPEDEGRKLVWNVGTWFNI